MSSAASQPQLRLVGTTRSDLAIVREQERRARRAVAAENLVAAHQPTLDPTDPRWVLAARAQGMLEGTALPADRRERVLRLAQRIGVRPFDANLIIAIVQDRARRGETIADAAPTIALIPEPEVRRSDRWTLARWAGAVAAAVLANAMLIWWLIG